MRLVSTFEDAEIGSEPRIQLSLSESEVEQLRETLPWLLRALADRPDAPARHRARRQKAHTLLQALLNAMPAQVTRADGHLERQ